MKLSVVYPQQTHGTRDVKDFARFVAERPGTRLWLAQSSLVDSFQVASFACGAGVRVPFGMGVSLTPLTHPVQAALQARSLAFLSGHEVYAGFGTGGKDFEASLLGESYDKPALAVGEYLEVARAALTDEPIEYQGTYYNVHARTTSVNTAPVLLGTGVLRPGMARVAGRTADFAMTWLCPKKYVESVIIPNIKEGADRAQRNAPRVVCVAHLALGTGGEHRKENIEDLCTPHLSAPHYRAMLEAAGLNKDGDAPPEEIAARLLDENVLLHGSAEDVADELRAFERLGVDEVALNVAGPLRRGGARRALAELRDVHAAYGGASSPVETAQAWSAPRPAASD